MGPIIKRRGMGGVGSELVLVRPPVLSGGGDYQRIWAIVEMRMHSVLNRTEFFM